jgi:putative hydrolase of the HAD superfamily
MTDKQTEMVFFDAGETIIHPLPSFMELFSLICSDHQVDIDLGRLPKITRGLMSGVEERQRQGYTFTNDAEESRKFWLGFYSNMVKEFGYSDEDDRLPLALYHTFSDPSNYGAYHDVQQTLDELRDLGLRLGLISNFEGWLEELLKDLDLHSYFEVLVISGQEEYEKPHPRIFELALERAGVPAHRALHIGDSPISDLEGALSVGMQAIIIDRWGRFPHLDAHRVADLREIPPLLKGDEEQDG